MPKPIKPIPVTDEVKTYLNYIVQQLSTIQLQNSRILKTLERGQLDQSKIDKIFQQAEANKQALEKLTQ